MFMFLPNHDRKRTSFVMQQLSIIQSCSRQGLREGYVTLFGQTKNRFAVIFSVLESVYIIQLSQHKVEANSGVS